MTIVRRTSPLGELVSLRQAMDRLFRITPTIDGQSTTASNGESGADTDQGGA